MLQGHRLARGLLEQDPTEEDIAGRVRAALPQTLRPHCLEATRSGSTATVFLDSSAWLTRARFLSDRILAALREHGIDEIRYRIRPPMIGSTPESADARVTRRLSDAVVAHLYEAAGHQTDDGLSEAFRRLAQRHAERNTQT
nr:DciA family protein [Thiocystis violacea]